MKVFFRLGLATLASCFLGMILVLELSAQDSVESAEAEKDGAIATQGSVGVESAEDALSRQPPPRPKLPDPKGAKSLCPPGKPYRIWIEPKQRQVIVDGYVSLQEGFLEMFACTIGTKEHESVVAVDSPAFLVHTGLLAVGAKTGSPAQFHPSFRPPTGTEIEIEVQWRDPQGNWQKARAQDWVLDKSTGKPMQQPWVFAGSGFWTDERTGKKHYMAESGDMICVSNFSTAMLDVPIESSDMNDGLIFEANPKVVPQLGTPVRLVLTPKLKPQEKPKAEVKAKQAEGTSKASD